MISATSVSQQPFQTQFSPAPVASPAPRSTGSERSVPQAPTGIGPLPASDGLPRLLGDRRNLKTLGQKLNDIATRLGENATPQAILTALKATT